MSIHDVAPRTLVACRQISAAIEAIAPALPLTLLVVPCYHGDRDIPREYVNWIEQRLARGDELALHGYTHRDDAPMPRSWAGNVRRAAYTDREGEFSALTRDEAIERIERGRTWFAERGWPLHGFVAPAWLLSDGTWEALRAFDFSYTTTLARFHVLRPRVVLRAPSVVYSTRSAWRRNASLVWNAALTRASAGARLVRVGFHPADAQHADVMAHALARIRRLAGERQALTKVAFARAHCAKLMRSA